jgi:hypothetical protein
LSHGAAGEPRNPTVAFEPTDVNTPGVVWFITALAVALVTVMVAMVGFYGYFFDRESQKKASQYPVAANTREHIRKTDPDKLLPPSPRLEGIAPVSRDDIPGRVRPIDEKQEHDVGRFRLGAARTLYEEWERTLNDTWEWVDDKHTAGRIPVSEAMDLLLKKPGNYLKARGEDRRDDTHPPSRTGSGRGPSEGQK